MKLPNTRSPFLDKDEELIERRSHLPHWFQEEKIQYITFRLCDSMPTCILNELKRLKEKFLLENPKPWNKYTRALFEKHFGHKTDYWLDQGHGSCIFKRSDCRSILEHSFQYVNYVNCIILGYVIMPNHVHILMLPYPGQDCMEILASVRKYSAKHINKLLDRKGRLWQRDLFDRIVRSPQHLRQAIYYIRQNPRHLSPDQYSLYFDEEALTAIDRIEVED